MTEGVQFAADLRAYFSRVPLTSLTVLPRRAHRGRSSARGLESLYVADSRAHHRHIAADELRAVRYSCM